jgi:hypothetical protein
MMLEGQAPQIWTLCIQVYLTLFAIRMIIFEKRITKNSLSILPLTITTIYIVYPQILINVFILFAIITFGYILLSHELKSRIPILNKIIYSSTILYLGFLIVFKSLWNDPVASGIRNNWGGGAIHIGINNFVDFILPLPGNALSISEPIYNVVNNGRLVGFISLLIAIVIQVLLFRWTLNRSMGLVIINIISLINGLICLLYLLSPEIFSSLIINDYFWFRLQVQFILFWIPSLLLNIYSIRFVKKIEIRNLKFLKITLIVLSIYTLKQIGGDYLDYSAIGSPSSCPKIKSNVSTYYFSDTYLVNSISIAACGVYNNLSDGNSPIFTDIKPGSMFTYIDPETLSPKYTIQVPNMIDTIAAPCFTSCVLKVLN